MRVDGQAVSTLAHAQRVALTSALARAVCAIAAAARSAGRQHQAMHARWRHVLAHKPAVKGCLLRFCALRTALELLQCSVRQYGVFWDCSARV